MIDDNDNKRMTALPQSLNPYETKQIKLAKLGSSLTPWENTLSISPKLQQNLQI
jgi:hypothetical protein